MAKTDFINGNPAEGIAGTIVTAEFLEGLNTHRHDGVDEDGHGALDYAVATGSANAYAISLTPALTAHIPGMPIHFKANFENTGPATVAISGMTAVAIKRRDGSSLNQGDIKNGQIVALSYDGTVYQLMSQIEDTSGDVGEVKYFASISAPTNYIKANGASINRTTYADLFTAITSVIGSPAISIASPGVVTLTGHGLINNDCISFETTGALPTGLTAGISYYVINKATDTFQVSDTVGGDAIKTSGSQSGTHKLRLNPFGVANLTTFKLPDLRSEFIRGWDDGRGVDSGRVFGSAQADSFASHRHGITGGDNGGTGSGGGLEGTSQSNPSLYITEYTGGAETRPRNTALLACVRYK